MNELLEKIWGVDIDLDESPSDELTGFIEQAQALNNSDDLSEVLFTYSKGSDLNKLIYILDVSTWCGSDNGAALHRTLESWLYGSDEKKIYVALNAEAYPFVEKQEMEKCLKELQVKYPQFRERCEYLINSRNRLERNG